MHHNIIGIFTLAFSAAAQDQTSQQAAPTPLAPVVQPTPPVRGLQANSQPSKIVMYRGSSIMGMGIACPVRYKEQQLVELARGKFAEWVVPAGRYILTNHT